MNTDENFDINLMFRLRKDEQLDNIEAVFTDEFIELEERGFGGEMTIVFVKKMIVKSVDSLADVIKRIAAAIPTSSLEVYGEVALPGAKLGFKFKLGDEKTKTRDEVISKEMQDLASKVERHGKPPC